MPREFNRFDVCGVLVTKHAQERLLEHYGVVFDLELWTYIARAVFEGTAVLLSKGNFDGRTHEDKTAERYAVTVDGRLLPVLYLPGERKILTVLPSTRPKNVARERETKLRRHKRG